MPPTVSPLWSSLALDRTAAASLQEQIVGYFQEAVLARRLRAGMQVPSSRRLAAEQGVARITVVQAYERLAAEGYLTSRPGAGLYVAESLPEPILASMRGGAARKRVHPALPRPRQRAPIPPVSERPLDLMPLGAGIPALDQFPWADWTRISARVYRERPKEALGYCDPMGLSGLRAAIAAYLGAARGIACEAEQVLVVAGSQQGIDLTARALTEPGDSIWVEEPGYPGGRAAAAAAGLQPAPIAVDDEGLDVGAARRHAAHARLALVTPSHQYPLGATLSLRRRLALLDWAESADAWILEDDYDGEYRYGGRPVAPLYALDRGRRVLYLGTFSKMLAPGLRLGYLVVPSTAVERLARLKAASDRHPPGLAQLVLARFITEGRLAAHLRRMRVLYAERRAALLEALRNRAAGLVDAGNPPEAGLHLVARLTAPGRDVAISRRAHQRGIHAAPLSVYYAGPRPQQGFVLGFAGTPAEAMAPAVERLAAAIRQPR